jgi:hypothetical protein
MQNDKPAMNDEYASVALAHLSMIAQAARGEYSPRPGEIDKRESVIVSFIRTGQPIATEEDRQLREAVSLAMTDYRSGSTEQSAVNE